MTRPRGARSEPPPRRAVARSQRQSVGAPCLGAPDEQVRDRSCRHRVESLRPGGRSTRAHPRFERSGTDSPTDAPATSQRWRSATATAGSRRRLPAPRSSTRPSSASGSAGNPQHSSVRSASASCLTAWETIPFRETFRRGRGRRHRATALAEADLYLAATERARRCLLLEGVGEDRILVSPPGIDSERFGRSPRIGADYHLIVSPGRLVWEKGHFDVIRALATLPSEVRLQIVGSGPERERLLRYAEELGVGERVDIRAVRYDEMPSFSPPHPVSCSPASRRRSGRSSSEWCSPRRSRPGPRSRKLVRSDPGSAGRIGGCLVLAGRLGGSRGPVSPRDRCRGPPGQRVDYPAEIVSRYSTNAVAERLAAAYERVLAARRRDLDGVQGEASS